MDGRRRGGRKGDWGRGWEVMEERKRGAITRRKEGNVNGTNGTNGNVNASND